MGLDLFFSVINIENNLIDQMPALGDAIMFGAFHPKDTATCTNCLKQEEKSLLSRNQKGNPNNNIQ